MESIAVALLVILLLAVMEILSKNIFNRETKTSSPTLDIDHNKK